MLLLSLASLTSSFANKIYKWKKKYFYRMIANLHSDSLLELECDLFETPVLLKI